MADEAETVAPPLEIPSFLKGSHLLKFLILQNYVTFLYK
jgi:hypothetical protein